MDATPRPLPLSSPLPSPLSSSSSAPPPSAPESTRENLSFVMDKISGLMQQRQALINEEIKAHQPVQARDAALAAASGTTQRVQHLQARNLNATTISSIAEALDRIELNADTFQTESLPETTRRLGEIKSKLELYESTFSAEFSQNPSLPADLRTSILGFRRSEIALLRSQVERIQEKIEVEGRSKEDFPTQGMLVLNMRGFVPLVRESLKEDTGKANLEVMGTTFIVPGIFINDVLRGVTFNSAKPSATAPLEAAKEIIQSLKRLNVEDQVISSVLNLASQASGPFMAALLSHLYQSSLNIKVVCRSLDLDIDIDTSGSPPLVTITLPYQICPSQDPMNPVAEGRAKLTFLNLMNGLRGERDALLEIYGTPPTTR